MTEEETQPQSAPNPRRDSGLVAQRLPVPGGRTGASSRGDDQPEGAPNARRDSGFSPVPGGRGGASSTQGQLPDLSERLVARKPRPRLKDFDYQGEYAYHVTIRATTLTRPFANITFGLAAIDVLKTAAESTNFRLLAYCLMPDHVHLLVHGEKETADLKRFVSLFKQRTGFAYRQQAQQQLWQVSYFDRALRRDESLQTVADYILQNPVKDGLAAEVSSYPLSGGKYLDPLPDNRKGSYGRGPEAARDRAETTVPTGAGASLPTSIPTSQPPTH